jgi:hypothetical protein
MALKRRKTNYSAREMDNGSAMRIVVWNCNMSFHRKYEHLFALNPDIAIIPVCKHRAIDEARLYFQAKFGYLDR